MPDYDDHYARWSYEQLIVQQPHIRFEGLWRDGFRHYIVCPDVQSAQTLKGESLRAWFHHKCRAITAPVEIVDTPSPSTERVPERTVSERAVLAGVPRNIRQTLTDLSLALPREFPQFTLDNPGAEVHLVTPKPLTEEERSTARNTYKSLGQHGALQFVVDPNRDPQADEYRYDLPVLQNGDIDLIPSRRLPSSFGRDLRFLVEEDDDTWVSTREALFSNADLSSRTLLPKEWLPKKLSCVVDASVFPPENIRTYLSLYDVVQLALPLESAFEKNCQALGLSAKELELLVQSGRVKLLLPQAVDRYPVKWLASVAESAPENLLFSRRLATLTVADARRRIPLLYPPLCPADRHALLHAMASGAGELVGAADQDRFLSFVGDLGEAWSSAELAVQSRGAMGTSALGVGRIAGAIYEGITGRDIRLELWSAAQKVEWAAALGSHVFPSTSGGYDEANACDLIAGIYGDTVGAPIVKPHNSLSAITDLLALDSSVSVVDFAREFASSDINRLRELVHKLATENVDPDYLAAAIENYNREVRAYERRPDQLKAVNIVGLFSAGAVAAGAVDPSVQNVVPLAGMLLGFVLNQIIGELPRFSTAGGNVVDFLNSALSGRMQPDAVLVARARKEVARLKK